MAPATVGGGAVEGSGGGGLGLDAHRERLLAELPDHVTLGEIVSKLPWKCLGKLALVSRAWLHAMRSREIYNARVICRALESFVVLRATRYTYPEFDDSFCYSYDKLYLHSTIDGFCLELPPLPVCGPGIPSDCLCVTLDGAIYVLGGRRLHCEYRRAYVLDLAGPRQWKRCASTLQQKAHFKCAALDGKIYVVENVKMETIRVSEVYDPKADTWCLIKPMPISPRRGLFIAVGEELFLLSEQMVDVANAAAPEFKYMADVYNPAKDEWRVETFYSDEGDQPLALLFEAQGKLHRLRRDSSSVLDMDTKRWTLRHSYVLSGLELQRASGVYGSYGSSAQVRFRVTAVGDEVLAIVGSSGLDPKYCLIQSEGFGGKDISLKWSKPNVVPDSHIMEEVFDAPYYMYPIQL